MNAPSGAAPAGPSLAWSSASISGCQRGASWWMGLPARDPAPAPAPAVQACGWITSVAGWKTSSIGCWKMRTAGANPGKASPLRSQLRRAVAVNHCRRSLGAGRRLWLQRPLPSLPPMQRPGRMMRVSAWPAGSVVAADPSWSRHRLRLGFRAGARCRVPRGGASIDGYGGCGFARPPGSCSRWCAARRSPAPPAHAVVPPPSDRRWC